MSSQPLWLLAYGLVFLGVLLLLSGVLGGGGQTRPRRRLGGVARILSGLLVVALGLLGVAIGVGLRGYQALTREVTAATVRVTPLGEQSYAADITLADGSERHFTLRGDELYVDAQILKWTPAANLIGLHTGYRLDRISGRYTDIRDETLEPRTVFELEAPSAVDLFATVRRYPFLAPVVDAQYGSGTFVPVGQGGTFLIRVSSTGLLVRPAATQER